jgi:hypothetical protein
MLPLVQSSCSRWVAEEDIISAQMKAGCLGQLESVSKRLRALTRGPVRNASRYNSLRGLNIQTSVLARSGRMNPQFGDVSARPQTDEERCSC